VLFFNLAIFGKRYILMGEGGGNREDRQIRGEDPKSEAMRIQDVHPRLATSANPFFNGSGGAGLAAFEATQKESR
jgi:hypothetical protein